MCGRGISVLKCIHVPALERERSCICVVGKRSCIFVVGVMYICGRGISLASLSYLSLDFEPVLTL